MSQAIREYEDDFIGQILDATHWTAATTQTAGSPSVAIKSGASEAGELELTLDATNEAQTALLSQNDKLWLPAARLRKVEFLVKIDAELNAAISLAFGLISAFNATHDSISQQLLLRKIGTGNILVESDDGVTDVDDQDAGINFAAGVYKRFTIDVGSKGLGDVQFGVDDNGHKRVLANTTFDVSQNTGAYQLYAYLSKTAAAAGAVVTIDRVRATYAK